MLAEPPIHIEFCRRARNWPVNRCSGIQQKAGVASPARKRGEGGTVGGFFRNARRHAHRAVAGLKTRSVAPPALVSKTSTKDSVPVLVVDDVSDERPFAIERGRDKSLA